MSRRTFIIGGVHGVALTGWAVRTTSGLGRARRQREAGRLTARPTAPKDSLAPGLHTLKVGSSRETLLYVPSAYRADKPMALVLALHGATQAAATCMRMFTAQAEESGFLLLAPSSDGISWDAIRGAFGADVTHIDKALEETFRNCRVDPHRLAVLGFSDGASYAVSLGRINGDLFTHVIAYSSGFIIPGVPHGKPQFFVSHGTRDEILPIDRCGRVVVARLREEGYSVRFEEFDGGHTVPLSISQESTRWFMG